MRNLILCLLLFPLLTHAQKREIFRIDSLPKEGVLLNQGWKWHAGDNPEWAKPEFDDTGWERVDPTQEITKLPQIRIVKIGYLRLNLQIDTSLVGKTLAIEIKQTIASEIYLNNHLIQTIGVVSEDPQKEQILLPNGQLFSLVFQKSGLQTLAVRYSFANPPIFLKHKPLHFSCFSARLVVLDKTIEPFAKKKNDYAIRNYVKIGIYILLFLIHLFFFVSFPVQKANLFICLYGLANVGIYHCENLISNLPISAPNHFFYESTLFILSIFLVLLSLLTVYTYLQIPKKFMFWVVLLLSILAYPISLCSTDFGVFYFHFILPSAVAIESIRVSLKGIGNKRTGAWFIVAGWVGYIVFVGCFFLAVFGVIKIDYFWSELSINVGLVSVPICFSLMLANDYAHTNRTLAQKLIELKSLAEEKQQILITQNETLEHQVTERTAELSRKNAELELEASLERVRSRALAMQQSKEVLDVAAVLYDELQKLDFTFGTIGINLIDAETADIESWVAGFGHENYPQSYSIPYFDHPFQKKFIDAWRNGAPDLVYTLTGKEKKDYDDFMFTHSGYKDIPDEVKKRMIETEFATFSLAFMRHGALLWAPTPLNGEKALIFQRFAAVFEQAYTRFLDLQKAETQAREAQIEAGLEKVRSRSMAMHHSSELSEVSLLLFQQMRELGLEYWTSGFCIWRKDDPDIVENWMNFGSVAGFLPPLLLPYKKDDGHRGIKEAAIRGELTYEQKFEGEDLVKHYNLMMSLPSARAIFEKVAELGLTPPPVQWKYAALFKQGYLLFVASEAQPNTLNIAKRFAKVFEQTYTRFLDLQKAETQAREAQIEAALERVRSRAIAMRHSDELSEAADLLYQEFLKMGVESYSCGYLINDDEKGEWKIWLTNPGEPFFKQFWTCPYFADYNLRARYESWQRQDEFHCAVLEGEENRAHNVLITKYAPWKEAMLDSLPPRLVFNSAHFSLGHLLVISPDRLAPELEQAMARFAKVFDLTWRRFLDLQKAEARAQEAKIDAGLDRVRAEIASMRATEDLERITPLVWRELTALEVPFFRCGVFIMDEEKETVHTYLSTPDGKPLGVLHLPFDSTETTRKTAANWRRQEVYLDNWGKQQFIAWVQSLTEQGYIRESEAYQGAEQPPEKLALHFVPFKQGMLYVGNSENLSKEQIDLVHRLADTLAVAYARYEDFTRLEEAKKQVETAFTELKSTQAQLIQSEKLASLGELTAGIAHEIQNPLNFVNNFAEVSAEMLEEMHEELEKGDTTEAIAIATDLKTNLEKINHHGQRASSIVKGMLEHSRSATGGRDATHRVSTDLNALADEYLRLAYHGWRAKDSRDAMHGVSTMPKIETHFDPDLPKIEIIPQDIGRVLLNLINNAFYAVQQRTVETLHATSPRDAIQTLHAVETLHATSLPYQPTVTLSTQKTADHILIKIQDNGNGIPEDIREKIFQPFFTTKPTGQGTGLGLSLAYDIVTKGHGGALELESQVGEGSTFIIRLA
jgi:signal transduction histidine kinase